MPNSSIVTTSTTLDDILNDDDVVLKVVNNIRRRGNLPELEPKEKRTHVVYSMDGEAVDSYRVEIQTDAASMLAEIDSASAVAAAVPKPKHRQQPEANLPAPRYTFNEALQEDMLENFHLVRYRYEDVDVPPPRRRSPRRKKSSSTRKRCKPKSRIVGSTASFDSSPPQPKRAQSVLGFNLLCGGFGCLPSTSVAKKPEPEPEEPAPNVLRRSMDSLRHEAKWLYSDMVGSASDSEGGYPSEPESTLTVEKKAGWSGGLGRLMTGLGKASDTSEYESEDYSFDDDETATEMGSLTVASSATESSISAMGNDSPKTDGRRLHA